MSIIQIALLQMTAWGSDQAANLAKGSEFCRRARALGADLALFPEMWNIGYTSLKLIEPHQRGNSRRSGQVFLPRLR